MSSYSWDDGAHPNATESNIRAGVRLRKKGSGFRFKIPADTVRKTLHLYVGAHREKGRFRAYLSDRSSAPFYAELDGGNKKKSYRVDLDFKAPAKNVDLIIEYKLVRKNDRSGSKVQLEAAALQMTGEPLQDNDPSSDPETVGDSGVASGDNGATGVDNGNSSSDSSAIDTTPVARSDSATIVDGSPASINVLANDTGLVDTPISLRVIAEPSHGAIDVNGSIITYTPDMNYVGQDDLVYRIMDTNGDVATATVSFVVSCQNCAAEQEMTLSWSPVELPARCMVTAYTPVRPPEKQPGRWLMSLRIRPR